MLRIYDTSLSVITKLRPVIGSIQEHDADLARQLRRASSSVVLNIAEGSYARGGNRAALYQVALGSAKETRACLDVALGLGYIDAVDAELIAGLSSVCAVLYRLVT
jgi:four helix bundle protein